MNKIKIIFFVLSIMSIESSLFAQENYSEIEKNNIETIKNLLTGFGTGDTSLINKYVDRGFINHMAPEGLQDRAGFKQIVLGVNSAFKTFDSYDVSPKILFSKGNYVAMMDVGKGVKNGKEFNHIDIHIFKMKNGKMAEHWNSFRLNSQEDKLNKFLMNNK